MGGLQSKAWNIVCVIDSNWLTVESPGRKPDWFGLVPYMILDASIKNRILVFHVFSQKLVTKK